MTKNRITLRLFFYLIGLYLLVLACAQQQPLTGGAKDEKPPQMNMEESIPNNQTNFQKQQLEFVFDEYIQLQNATKQVVISPPLQKLPNIRTRLNKLIFEFPEDEILKEDATYSINFGEAVKDLTEGNPVPNFRFIFSTGDHIDSLQAKGTILDALTGEPVADALYLLYKNLADSVVYTDKPFYFARTNKQGEFLIENIKGGIYKGFALEDQDLNYLYNIPSERIGFSADTILLTDSTNTDIQVALFEPYTLVGKPKANLKNYGVVPLVFKRTPFDAEVELEDIGQTSFIERMQDTIKVWYHSPDSIDWRIFVHRDTITDTLMVKALPKKLAQKQLNLANKRKARNGKANSISVNPTKPIPLTFNYPLSNIDTSLILFSEDSVKIQQKMDTFNLAVDSTLVELDTSEDSIQIQQKNDTFNPAVDSTLLKLNTNTKVFIKAAFAIDSLEQRTIQINYPWKETLKYNLQILPGAITSLYGRSNIDTIQLNYLIKKQKDFGTINLQVIDMDSLQQYQVELLFADNVVETFSIADTKTYKRTFTSLPPGNYSVKVVQDLNRNGRWDAGDYAKKLQPEKIAIAALEELKANWEVEAEVKVTFENE